MTVVQTLPQDNQIGAVGMGRAFLVGALIGFLIVGGVTAAISLIAGAAIGPAIGIGVFAGFWGGPGFGGMLGVVTCASKQET